MKLEDIGFYTLSDDRCRNASVRTPIMRAEIVLTDRCNFKCHYCRGLRRDLRGDMPISDAMAMLDLLDANKTQNIRFSGGEPTIYDGIEALVLRASRSMKRVALSTNGSAPYDIYAKLIDSGVNDFSISLDACCASTGDKICGVAGSWKTVIENIRRLSRLSYVTVGIVLSGENISEVGETIDLASSLGVSDIRVIPAAQFSSRLHIGHGSNGERHPILRYRLQNMASGVPVRGLSETDNRRCPLVLDDLAVAGDYHFPCIIYMREAGNPIGKWKDNGFRKDRERWFESHDCYEDVICQKNCLDVCRDYNNAWLGFRSFNLDRIDGCLFDWQSWRLGADFISEFGFHLRWNTIKSNSVLRESIKSKAIGWCPATQIPCRPKENHAAVMFMTSHGPGWVHLRNSEMFEIWRAA